MCMRCVCVRKLVIYTILVVIPPDPSKQKKNALPLHRRVWNSTTTARIKELEHWITGRRRRRSKAEKKVENIRHIYWNVIFGIIRKSGRRYCGQVFSHTTNEAKTNRTDTYNVCTAHTDRCSFIANANDNPHNIQQQINANNEKCETNEWKLMEI